MSNKDDLIYFADEHDAVSELHTESSSNSWPILIVDDDEDVHLSTMYSSGRDRTLLKLLIQPVR